MSLQSQIIQIAQQAAQNQAASFQSTTQITQAAAQTQYLGQVLAWTGSNYAIGFPDGSVQNVPPGGYSAPSVGDTVVVINGVIVA
jgi:hypothetical protein